VTSNRGRLLGSPFGLLLGPFFRLAFDAPETEAVLGQHSFGLRFGTPFRLLADRSVPRDGL